MSGIVGCWGVSSQEGENLLNQMIALFKVDDEQRQWSYYGEGCGVARVSPGIVNPDAQPIWDEQKQIAIFMEGEFYNTGELRKRLTDRGCIFRSQGDAELILRLYQETGDLFPAQLNGNFIIAIIDHLHHKLIVINDRMGIYPLYYARIYGRVLFGSGVRALLADPDLPKNIDKTAIAEFLTFDHVLGDRTLLESVKLLPQGSVMTVSDDQFNITPYSSLRYPEIYALKPEKDYIDELIVLLRTAIQRQTQDELSKAVMLSGGMDSRLIAALMNEMEGNWPFHTFTWGIPGCDDARYAREVAQKTRAQHHFFTLKPDFLLQTSEKAVQITDGMGNLVNLHALVNLKEETEYSRVIYKGFLGDAMFGYALRHQHWAEYDPDTALQAHLQVYYDQDVITFRPNVHSRVFTQDFCGSVGNSVIEELRDGMLDSKSRMLADQRLYFDLTQRVPRMTIKGVEVVRCKAHVRLPFTDNDLLDFSIHIPPGLKFERSLVQHAFQRSFPGLASIPISWTGMPMQSNFRELWMQVRKFAQWHLHRIGLSPKSDIHWKPYADYQNWFRGTLRNWLEDILLSKRFFERGYYRPDFIRNILSQHMAGEDHAVRIGALLAVEIWHRLYID